MTPLERLLAATPAPPTNATVEELLAAFEQLLAARAAILATLVPITAAERPLLRELELRHEAWQGALSAAQHAVGTQRQATQRLRAYAP